MFQSFMMCLIFGASILSLALVIYYTFQFKTQIADLEIKFLADSIKLQESLKKQIRGSLDFYFRETTKTRK